MDISVSLDINKAGQFINEPVTMRIGETDNVIKATIFKDNKPFTDFKTATFNTTRIDGTVIANDPATVDGNIVTYSVAPAVTGAVGKLRNSYFLLDGKTSTESFEVAILSGVSKSGKVTDFIPGFQELQDELEKVNSGMSDKLDGIDKEVDTFLANVQTEINDKNSKFTDEQKNQITSAMNDLKEQVTDSENDVNAMNDKLAAIKDSVKDFNVPQITADTKKALDTVNELDIKSQNLLSNGDLHNGLSGLNVSVGNNSSGKVVIETVDEYTAMHIVAPNDGSLSGIYTSEPINTPASDTYYHKFNRKDGLGLNNGETYTASLDYKGMANLKMLGLADFTVPIFNQKLNSTDWKHISFTSTPKNVKPFEVYIDSGDLYVKNIAVYRGNIDLGYSLSSTDVVKVSDTGNYQKTKVNADNGGVMINVNRGDTVDQDTSLISSKGLQTFYIHQSADGNDTGDSIRGIVHAPGGYGYAIGVNNISKAYYKAIANGIAGPWQELATVAATAPVAAMAYTAMVQDDTNSKLQAQNSQIAYSLMTQGGTTSDVK